MLKKKLGSEAIERDWYCWDRLIKRFKVPSTLIIPEGCEMVGYCAFFRCEKLRKVVIPESVVEIGDFAFEKSNATIILKKPKRKFKYIGDGAFVGCKNVKEEVGN